MDIVQFGNSARISDRSLWISDAEVHQIFGHSRCYYMQSNGLRVQKADGQFIRYQRSKEGTLGYVYRNPLTGENWLWVISRKTRKPLAIARVG